MGKFILALLLVFQANISKADSIMHDCQYIHTSFSAGGNVCMPGHDHGFLHAHACEMLYYCVLSQVYQHFISDRSPALRASQFKELRKMGAFSPPSNTRFVSYGYSPGGSKSPFVWNKLTSLWRSRDLVWLTSINELKNKICHNISLLSMYEHHLSSRYDALALFMRQILGMPPLRQQAAQSPYRRSGLYVLLPAYGLTFNAVSTTSPIRDRRLLTHLCRSGYLYNMPASACSNKAGDHLGRYEQWAASWIRHSYPSCWLSRTITLLNDCFSLKDVLPGNRGRSYFPWTSIGITYNWSEFDGLSPLSGIENGLYEYSLPSNVLFARQHLHFIPLNKVESTLCRHHDA